MSLGINALPGEPLDQGAIADLLHPALVEILPPSNEGLNSALMAAASYAHHLGLTEEGFLTEALVEAAVANGRTEEEARKECQRAARRVLAGDSTPQPGAPRVDRQAAKAAGIRLAALAPPPRHSLPIPQDPAQQFDLWLSTCYAPTDRLTFSFSPTRDVTRTVADWQVDPPTPGPQGLWVRANPMGTPTGYGGTAKDADVAAFKWLVLESDDLPVEAQPAVLRTLGLHPYALVHSGGKSVHAWFAMEATTQEEYRAIARGVTHALREVGFDASMANPSRRSRAPGMLRGDTPQALLHLDPTAPPLTATSPAAVRQSIESLRATATLNANVFMEDIGEAELCEPDLVQGLLTPGSLTVLYGPSNVGKSFWAYDLAAHIATGRPWRQPHEEIHVQKGGVLFIALEGGRGARNRLRAMRKAGLLDNTADLAVNFTPISLMDPACVTAVRDMILDWRRRRPHDPVLIVLDTLSRAFGGGNENSPDDMGLAVVHMDKIRAMTKAALLAIHHSGKDEAKGARGHSSLRAATDTEIELFRPEGSTTITAIVKKQRDIAERAPMPFQLETHVLFKDAAGYDVTSCTVQHLPEEEAGTREAVAERKDNATLKEDIRRYEKALNHLPQASWRAWAKAADMDRRTLERVVKRVEEHGSGRHVEDELGKIDRVEGLLPTLE